MAKAAFPTSPNSSSRPGRWPISPERWRMARRRPRIAPQWRPTSNHCRRSKGASRRRRNHGARSALAADLTFEGFEGDDGMRVPDAIHALHLFIDEVSDIGAGIDVEFHQQIVVAGGRVDFGGDLGFGQFVGYLIGFAELAFDLDKEGCHRAPPTSGCSQSSKNTSAMQGALALSP